MIQRRKKKIQLHNSCIWWWWWCYYYIWIVDLAALFHVSFWHEFFTSHIGDDFGYVKIENDRMAKIMGMGKFWKPIWCKIVLNNVRMLLKCILIFTSVLDDEDCVNIFSNERWKLIKDNLVLAKERKDYNL